MRAASFVGGALLFVGVCGACYDSHRRDAAGGDERAAGKTGRADTSGTSGSGATCVGSSVTVTRVVPAVMLLLDGSSSMGTCYGSAGREEVVCPEPGFPPPPLPAGAITRWDAIRRAVVDPEDGVVARLQDRVRFGVAVFGTTGTCPLPLGVIAPALDNLDAIASNVPVAPSGTNTPTGEALDRIVDMLPDPSAMAGGMIGPQIVVLATDGDPNSCDPTFSTSSTAAGTRTDYAPSIAAALKLQAKNQRMFVIGVGDGASKAHLQAMANIGAALPTDASPGAEVFYPEDPAALAAMLDALLVRQVTCEAALSGRGVAPSTACMGHVELNGQALECNGQDGWELTDPLHIRLRGSACEAFKQNASAVLHAQFACADGDDGAP